jgi:hypothetical protein
MEALIMGILVSLNFIILIYKFKKARYFDAIIDGSILVAIAIFMSGSQSLLFSGIIGSFIVSLYLLISPPKLGKVELGDLL